MYENRKFFRGKGGGGEVARDWKFSSKLRLILKNILRCNNVGLLDIQYILSWTTMELEASAILHAYTVCKYYTVCQLTWVATTKRTSFLSKRMERNDSLFCIFYFIILRCNSKTNRQINPQYSWENPNILMPRDIFE